jgi:site-specific DNA-methyltransferase (adenine-specific)
MKGDCLEKMKEIESGSVDAIITDPPYGTTACKWDSVIPFDLMWEQLNRIIKPNGAIVLFGSEPFSSALRMSNIKNYKYDFKWHKDKCSNFLQAKTLPRKTIEDICVFSNAGVTHNAKIKYTYNSQLTDRKARKKTPKTEKSDLFKQIRNDKTVLESGVDFKSDKNYAESLIYFKTIHKGREHPTQKPVALMEYLIKTYTNEGETVLDFTMGSGTTGVACVNTNRSFIGIEMDDKYFEIAKERITEVEL